MILKLRNDGRKILQVFFFLIIKSICLYTSRKLLTYNKSINIFSHHLTFFFLGGGVVYARVRRLEEDITCPALSLSAFMLLR